MASSAQSLGDRVYCHVCEHEWERSQGGLQCPECGSEHVEFIEATTRPQDDQPDPLPSPPPPMPSHPIHGNIARSPPPIPNHPLHDHNPWSYAPDSAGDGFTTFEFNNGSSRGTFSYASRTVRFGGNNRGRDPAADAVFRDFESMVTGMIGGGRTPRSPMGGGFVQFPPQPGSRGFATQNIPSSTSDPFSMILSSMQTARQQTRTPGPFDLLGMLFNAGSGQHGDAVYSDEALDRIMSQLMDQSQGNGAPPASEAAISTLQKKPVNEEMMGSDGKAECSICMDTVEIGDQVTFLPCNHWFHGDCVVSWLKEHDTCPHCRKPITSSGEAEQSPAQTSSRRRSRRVSSVASPQPPPSHGESARYGPQVIDSPGGTVEAHQRYHGNYHSYDFDRPRSERRSSGRSDRGPEHAEGGVGGWLRSRMPF